MEVRRVTSSELTHHGKDGQKWGVMHGPPYPLDKNATVQAKKKKKSLMTKIKDKRKGKQLQKAKAAKKAEREEKERIINSGDSNQVKKIAHKLTDEELNRALNKIELTSKLSEYSSSGPGYKKTKTGMDYVQDAAKVAQAIDSFAKAGASVVKFTEALNLGEKKSKGG